MPWETNISDPDAILEAEYCIEASYPDGADRRDSVRGAVGAGEFDADRGNDFGDGERDGREPEGGG